MNLETIEEEDNSLRQNLRIIKGDGSAPFWSEVLYIASFIIGFLTPLGIGITMLAIGIINKDGCPAEDRLPKFLIVSGCLSLICSIVFIVNFVPFMTNVQNIFKFYTKWWKWLLLVYGLILTGTIVCLSLGTACVIRMDKPDYEHQDAPGHCDELTYKISLYLLPVLLSAVAVVLLSPVLFCICCFCSLLSSEWHLYALERRGGA